MNNLDRYRYTPFPAFIPVMHQVDSNGVDIIEFFFLRTSRGTVRTSGDSSLDVYHPLIRFSRARGMTVVRSVNVDPTRCN
jgi:hypothetical protein